MPGPYAQSDDPVHDLGPWIEAPSSSRVRAYRFDYGTNEIQVTWRNNKNPGYVYRGTDRHLYIRFARAVSKGKMINRVLDGFFYEPISPSELNAPSNPNRQALSSRVVY